MARKKWRSHPAVSGRDEDSSGSGTRAKDESSPSQSSAPSGSGSRAKGKSSPSQSSPRGGSGVDGAEGVNSSAGTESGSDSSGSVGRRKRGDEGGSGNRSVRCKSDSRDSPPRHPASPPKEEVDAAAADQDAEHNGESVPPVQDADAHPTFSDVEPQSVVSLLPHAQEGKWYCKKELAENPISLPLPRKQREPDLVGGDMCSQLAKKLEESQSSRRSKPTSFSTPVNPHKKGQVLQSASPTASQSQVHGSSDGTSKTCYDTDESLEVEFLYFLKNFIAPGEIDHYYPVQLRAKLSQGGSAKFRIQFEHLLIHKPETDFAIKLCKRRHLCFPIIEKFIADIGYPQGVLRRSDVELFRFPLSIVTLEDLLADKRKLMTTMTKVLGMQHVSVQVLSDLTIALLSGFLDDIRDKHKKGLSWNGLYTLKSMVVINGCEFRIMTKPTDYEALKSLTGQDKFIQRNRKDPFDAARANDLKVLETSFTSKLKIDEDALDTAHNFPVLYSSLRDEMRFVTAEKVKSDNFWVYLINHPALKHPVVRHNLVCNMHLLSDESDNLSDTVKNILQSSMPVDWRVNAKTSDANVLQNVYFFDPTNPNEKIEDAKEAVMTGRKKDPFENTMSGHLKYERHYLNHAHNTVPGYSMSEREIFFSSRFTYLPVLLKLLTCAGAFTFIEGQKPDLYEAWISYSSFHVRTVENLEGSEFLNLAFW